MMAYARQLLGDDEIEQLERIAAWRGRLFTWELVDEIRRQAGRTAATLVPLREETLVDDTDPADVAAQREAIDRLRARVRAMRPRLRMVAEMRLGGSSPVDVARALGVSERRAAVLWREARDAIVAPAPPPEVKPHTKPLPDLDPAALAAVRPLEDVEREAIEVAMRATRGDVEHAARLLGIGRATLYRRLGKWRSVPAGEVYSGA